MSQPSGSKTPKCFSGTKKLGCSGIWSDETEDNTTIGCRGCSWFIKNYLCKDAPKTHILSLTYKPKIEAVKAGTIRQTIRLKRSDVEKRPGDRLLLHTWAGLPYRSKWDWRLNVRIKEIILLWHDGSETWWVYDDSDFLKGRAIQPAYHPTYDDFLAELAKRDGIVPPTRQGLESTLKALNNLDSLKYTHWGVIRW
ncbi:MAG: hypothetical protein A4E30_00290 [Methanomassiliicoccales archaeon PtaB.Bin215]|nr:MAG: hypothetical protein A4E30_00290 [Methanomassiliicoccales archaeon PtaB.Bin215]